MAFGASVRCMTLLATVWHAFEVTSTKVDQFPKDLTVHRGANVSMFCTFSIQQVTPDVYWWRWGEKTFIEPDSRKIIYTKKGSADFVLLNACVADSGVYYCKVKHQQQSIGDGPGSRLTVFAPPTPPNISPIKGSSPPRLVCKTAAFFPKEVKIFWQRNGVTIYTGEEPVNISSVEGLYEASSFLEVTKPTWRVVIYTCLVSHVSLALPARVDYTVKPGSARVVHVLRNVGGTLIILLVLATLRIVFGSSSAKGSVVKVDRLVETSEQTMNREEHGKTSEHVIENGSC